MPNNGTPPGPSQSSAVKVGGFSLIAGAIAFMLVFSYLAERFNYPEVLDGRASDVLPALLATGEAGRAVWAIYSLLPLIWIPAAVGAFHALRPQSEGRMRLAMSLAVVSSLAMILGLMRWPSFHWELARTWSTEPNVRPSLEAVFNATNRYLGNYIGEFLGELCMSIFFLLSATAMVRRDSGFARWTAWLGIATSVAGLAGMFRNVTQTVAVIAELNNYLLPVWMIIFGVSLLLYAKRSGSVVVVSPVPAAA